MILKSQPIIERNVKMEDYIACEGKNKYWLTENDGKELCRHIAKVRWEGKGSPYPTPPGFFKMRFVKNHSKFGDSWIVDSDKESDVMVHFANLKSYGCLIINPTEEGKKLYEEMLKHKDELWANQLEPIDMRSEEEKKELTIDYTRKMT